jgi:hypothetical protein
MVRQLEEKSGEEMCLFKEEPTSQLASQPASQPANQAASQPGRQTCGRTDVQIKVAFCDWYVLGA